MAQIRFWIDTVQTARSDQSVQQCTTFATMIAPEEDVVFLSQADGAKRPLRGVIVGFRQTVTAVVTQGIPLVQGIRERLSQPGFFRQCRTFLHHPLMQ